MSEKNNLNRDIFSLMLENFLLTKENSLGSHKSIHWDVFPDDYEQTINSSNGWKNFLRNPISLGFNDDLIKFDNARWDINKKTNNVDAWKRKAEHNYEDLLPEIIEGNDERNEISNCLKKLLSICGIEFISNNQQSQIGSPPYVPFNLKDLKQKKTIHLKCNLADLGNIYYFFQIDRILENFNIEKPIVAEIGAGYGGLITKLKKKYTNAKCIIFDLPESSCVQTYYLSKEFPNSKILFYKDFTEKNVNIFFDNFDFLILPCNVFEKLPECYLDLIINVRSMMEMKLDTINYYFKTINKTIKENGLLACFNRYIKNTSGENIIFKNYPYGKHWSLEISQTSAFQHHIHDLILRKNFAENFDINEKLKTLPPY